MSLTAKGHAASENATDPADETAVERIRRVLSTLRSSDARVATVLLGRADQIGLVGRGEKGKLYLDSVLNTTILPP